MGTHETLERGPDCLLSPLSHSSSTSALFHFSLADITPAVHPQPQGLSTHAAGVSVRRCLSSVHNILSYISGSAIMLIMSHHLIIWLLKTRTLPVYVFIPPTEYLYCLTDGRVLIILG